ncbi:hypothetical protein AA313_de0204798 [Arthrobotrys entomopaga]|nr:hypothetical protein AA313_de0204798 [Arthrobotrys entomopaga]
MRPSLLFLPLIFILFLLIRILRLPTFSPHSPPLLYHLSHLLPMLLSLHLILILPHRLLLLLLFLIHSVFHYKQKIRLDLPARVSRYHPIRIIIKLGTPRRIPHIVRNLLHHRNDRVIIRSLQKRLSQPVDFIRPVRNGDPILFKTGVLQACKTGA